MKLMIGFIAGLAVGVYLASNMTDEQRARTSAAATRATRRVQDNAVVRSVSNNVGQVGGAASDRVADAVDSAGDSITDAIQADAG